MCSNNKILCCRCCAALRGMALRRLNIRAALVQCDLLIASPVYHGCPQPLATFHHLSDARCQRHGSAWVLNVLRSSWWCPQLPWGVSSSFSCFYARCTDTALTTTVVGVLRGVVTILLGFALTIQSSLVLCECCGSSQSTHVGGVWYTWIKVTETYGSQPHDFGGKGKSTENKSKIRVGPDGKLISYAKLGQP